MEERLEDMIRANELKKIKAEEDILRRRKEEKTIAKRKRDKVLDIARRQAKARIYPPGDVTKAWTKQFLQVEVIEPGEPEPFYLKRVNSEYKRD